VPAFDLRAIDGHDLIVESSVHLRSARSFAPESPL